MDDELIPAPLDHLLWARREESPRPTGSGRLRGHARPHHETPGALHTAGEDAPAMGTESRKESQMKGAFVSALCFFVWQLTQTKPLTTVWWEPAAIRSRSPGLASVHFSSSSVTDEDSSFFRGDFNVPSALTSTRLSSLTHEEKTQLVTFY